MKYRIGYWLQRVCARLLKQSVRLYPVEKQSWGEAALAELQAAPTTFSALRWTVGGLWVAIRSYVLHAFRHPADPFLGHSSLLRYSWRSLSPVLLTLSLAFFFVPQFRQALETTTSLWAAGSIRPRLTDREARTWQIEAEREHDAQTLAFLALRGYGADGGVSLAETAASLEPNLAWILGTIALNNRFQVPPEWLKTLQRREPDNAFTWLLQAQFVRQSIAMAGTKLSPELLTSNQEFRSCMARAFGAPNYDSYLGRRFELDRSVLKKHHMEKPLLLMVGLNSHPLPNLYGIRAYATWLIADAKSAGNIEREENQYWQVVHFGQKMELHSYSSIERLMGSALQQLGGDPLLPILSSEGKEEVAATLRYALEHFQRLDRRDAMVRAMLIEPKTLTEDGSGGVHLIVYLNKSDYIVHGAAFIFIVSLALTAMSFIYLRLSKAQGISSVTLPPLIAYTPPLLFASALALFVSFLPYARIFQMYMADPDPALARLGPVRDFEPLWAFAKLEIVESYGRALIWPVILVLAVLIFALYKLVRMRRALATA